MGFDACVFAGCLGPLANIAAKLFLKSSPSSFLGAYEEGITDTALPRALGLSLSSLLFIHEVSIGLLFTVGIGAFFFSSLSES